MECIEKEMASENGHMDKESDDQLPGENISKTKEASKHKTKDVNNQKSSEEKKTNASIETNKRHRAHTRKDPDLVSERIKDWTLFETLYKTLKTTYTIPKRFRV